MSTATTLVFSAALLAACVANKGQPFPEPPAAAAAAGAAPVAGSAGSAGAAVECEAPGFTGAQRLTRAEYDKTVSDLLGTTATLGQRFPEDNRANVFDNNAQVNGVTPLVATAYFEAADVLAQEVVSQQPGLVISCQPGPSLAAEACATQILGSLLRRAYRRPVEAQELEAVLVLYRAGAVQSHELGLQNAIHGVLVAPQFLFKGVSASLGVAHELDQHALATRLSYFLWGTMPDDTLFQLAEQGALGDASSLLPQIQRMLLDPRASALVESFAGQWLALRMLDVAEPDKALFPTFTAQTRVEMLSESQTLLRFVFTDGAPVLDLLTAPYTFVNGTRVDLSDTDRRGIFSHASLLTVTSNPDRTSVVRRGKWIMDTLLCDPLPPPPSGIDITLPDPLASANKFEQLEQHRVNPTCNACHSIVDPLGFALEAYDPIGRLRTVDEQGRPLYTLGSLPDGTVVSGARQLSEHLATTGRFESCLTENLLAYALGRELAAGDRCVVEQLVSSLDFKAATLSGLVAQVVASAPFRAEGAAP